MTEAEGGISKAIVLLLVKDKLVQVVMAGADEREGGGVVDKDAMAAFAESSHIFSPLSHVASIGERSLHGGHGAGEDEGDGHDGRSTEFGVPGSGGRRHMSPV